MSESAHQSENNHKAENPLVKAFVEIGPLVIFFVAYFRAGLFAATGVFMVATIISLAYARLKHGRFPPMLLITAAIVVIFGGLTLVFGNPTFIKMKPTIVYLIFATILLGGLVAKRNLLKPLFGSAFAITQKGWNVLTLRWGLFFIGMAGVNEIVWRTMSTDFWVSFKLFGAIPLTLVFALAQTPLILRHQDAEKADENTDTADD